MNSRIYKGSTRHVRFSPKRHEFRYPLYVFSIDLKELQTLSDTSLLFSYNKFNLFSIYDKDYFFPGNQPLYQKIIDFLDKHYSGHKVKNLTLVSTPRFINYSYNPVSFYYGFDNSGDLNMVIAEVTNTYKEMFLYVLENPSNKESTSSTCFIKDKDFHVSPFFNEVGTYSFKFSSLSKSFSIHMTYSVKNQEVFYANLIGNQSHLNSLSMTRLALSSPLTAFKTMPRIIYQAAKLYYIKGLPAKSKPLNNNVIRPINPTLIQKLCMKKVFSILKNINVGLLEINLPNHKSYLFGDIKSSKKNVLNIGNYRLFNRLVFSGEIGFGEAFVDNDWECDDLVALLILFINNQDYLFKKHDKGVYPVFILNMIKHFFKMNFKFFSRRNISAHYDLSNKFYSQFLDSKMMYSSAYYPNEKSSLETAQQHKITSIINKMNIKPDQRILEIGSGWGSFAFEAVKQTGCHVTTITLSENQFSYIQKRIDAKGLHHKIDLKLCDYRDLCGTFDHIISIEMIEAVGYRYLPVFFEKCYSFLKKDGSFFLQSILIPDKHYETYSKKSDWIKKHIFPGGHLPSFKTIQSIIEKNELFTIDSIEYIGKHYARTLYDWRQNFIGNKDKVEESFYDDSFFNKWIYYLSYCEAGFLASYIDNAQFVLKKI